jgi:hypothetical protein
MNADRITSLLGIAIAILAAVQAFFPTAHIPIVEGNVAPSFVLAICLLAYAARDKILTT